MLKKILNILLVLVIVLLIGTVLVNLYNKSKLETDNFNKTSEKVKKDDSKKDSDKKNSKKASDENSEKASDNNKTSDKDISSTDNSNNDKSKEDTSEDNLSSSLVSVESTSSYKNNYIYIIGCITILVGLSKVALGNKN